MKICVFGGTGYVGEHLVKRLLEQGNEVTVLARNEGRLVLLKEKSPAIKIVIGDVIDPFDVEKAMKGVDGVYHLAAMKSVTLAEENIKECIETNVDGSITVLAATLWVKPKFIVGISTDKAVTRTGVYGVSKYLMERLFDEYRTVNPDTKYQIVRLGNIWGSTGSIGVKWPEKIKREEKIEVSSFQATRFWLTVDEAIDIILNCKYPLTVPKLKAASLLTVCSAFVNATGNSLNSTEVGLKEGENLHETLDGKIYSNQVEQYSVPEFIEKFLK